MVWAEKRSSDGGPRVLRVLRVAYAYDAFGNRVRRVQYDGSLAVVSDQRYAQDGWDTAKPGAVGAENFDVFADLDAAGTVTARRVFGPGFDEPVARLDPSGEVGWYGTDSQDSVRLIFDNTGTVTGSRDYTAFGAITAEAGAGLDRYAYTAREWDAALGLQSNRQRMYDPLTGRFTSEDPSGLSAGDVNLFRYAGNAVTTHTDPSGLDWWSDVRSFGQRMYDGNATFRGVYNGADKMAHGLGQIPLLMRDAIASGVGAATGRSVNYHSDYGRGLAQAQAEGRADQYAMQAMVNALSLGTYGTVIDGLHAAQNYADTGDPTQLQEWSGELLFFAAAMTPLGRAKAKSCPVKKATTVETPISREPAVTVETPNEFGGLPPELFDPVDTGAPPPNVAPASTGPQFRTWNQFQAGTAGQFSSRAEAATAWQAYRQANGIVTGTVRSQAARAAYLRSLADHPNTPSWMRQWLSEGRLPPGYEVDHITPLSIGGADTAANMRLQAIDLHRLHHRFYRPWEW